MTELVKKLHMYAGLLTFSALIVYGISGLFATFLPAPEAHARPQPAVRYENFVPAPNASDQDTARRVYEHLKLPLSSPVPGWNVKRNAENNLQLDFWTMNGMTRVLVLEKENRLRVETGRNTIWQFLDSLHSTTMRAESGDWRVRAWKYYNEFAIWCLLGMSMSGVYLWLASRPSHRVAQACFGAGTATFLVLYVLTR